MVFTCSIKKMEVLSVTQFDEALSQHSRVVVDCHAQWCGPCKQLAPVLNDLAQAHPTVTLLLLDVDDAEEELVTRLGVTALPTVIFYRDGHETEKVCGFSAEKIRNAFIHTAS